MGNLTLKTHVSGLSLELDLLLGISMELWSPLDQHTPKPWLLAKNHENTITNDHMAELRRGKQEAFLAEN